MSVRSLAALAVARDAAPAGQPAGGGGGAAAVAPGGQPGAGAGATVPQGLVDVLTSAIPTEPLAAYTALVGITAGAVGSANTYLPFRWWAYAVFLVVVFISVWVAYRRASKAAGVGNQRKLSFPVTEAAAALLAASGWGLAMPGSPLNVQLTGTPRTLASASIVIGIGALLTLAFGPQLKVGTGSAQKLDVSNLNTAPVTT
jgi:hypothetical protein